MQTKASKSTIVINPTNKAYSALNKIYKRHLPLQLEHKYNTRSKIPCAENNIQLKENQIKNSILVTHYYIHDIINPQNQLKHKKLIAGPDQKTWKK